MPNFILAFSILMMMIISGCNNPSGGSVISRGNAPLLKPPSAFNFTQIRAANGTAELKWKSSYRADNYKVYMGTSATTSTMTEYTGCTGMIVSCSVPGLIAGTTYYFNVISSNAAGTINIASVGSALTVGSFDILTSTPSDGQIAMSWNPSAGATTYVVKYGTNPGSYSNTTGSVTSPYTLSGLSNGRTYYFRVVATNAFNGYAESDSEGSGLTVGPPDAPTGLALVPNPGQMSLAWNSVTGATGYKIYRGLTSGSQVQIGTSPSTSYIDPVINGTEYFYSIKSYNALYDSAFSNVVSGQSIADFTVTSVTTGAAANQLVVTWPNTTGATQYDIRYGTSAAALTSVVSNATSPRTITGLTAGTTYYFRVVASNAVGSGATLYSTNTLSGVPLTPAVAPTALTATATPGQVILNWTAAAGAASYEVLRGTVSGSYTSVQAGITATTYTHNAVTNGIPYYYVVRSFNGLNSPYSNERVIQTIAGFSITAVTSTAAGSLTVTWPAVVGADAYDVLYRSGVGAYVTVANVSSGYTITGLTSGTTYYVAVRAKNSIGAGTTHTSLDVSAIPMTTAPAALTAATSPPKITLNWPVVTGALTYTVYRSAFNGGPYTSIASGLTSLTYDDTRAADGTTLYYRVTATNGSESAYSPQAFAEQIAAFALTSVVPQSSTVLRVNWPAVTGAANYDVRYRIGAGANTTLSNRTSPFDITALAPNTSYNVSVVAKNAVGSGATEASAEVAGLTATAAPVGLTAVTTTGQIVLTWTAVAGATSYKIYRGTVTGTLTEVANNNVPASYTDSPLVAGNTYFYAVSAFNGSDSARSTEVSGHPIAAFNIDATTALSPTSIKVDWTAPAGAGALYDILYRSTVATTTVANVSAPTYTLTGLSAGTTYYISVRAKNSIDSGTTTTTPEATQITPIGPPTVTLAAAPGQVTVTLSAVAGATSYKIMRGTSPSTYDTIYTGFTGPTYIDSVDITNGQVYYYSAQTFNGTYSADAVEKSVKPIATFSITSTSATASSVTANWNNSTLGADAFDIEYRTGAAAYSLIPNVTSPRQITGLLANTTYDIKVTARNAQGAGTSFTTAVSSRITATAAPTALVATSSASGTVGLNWTAAAGATSYKVFRSLTAATFDYNTPITTVGGTAFLDTGLINGTTYYYVVRATNGSDSVSSNEVSLRPIETPFVLSSVTATSSSTLDLNWIPATGAANYKVVYGLTPASSTFSVDSLTGPTYTLTGLTPNTLYYVRVVAQNAVGTGVAITSNELNATTATTAPAALIATTSTLGAVGQISLGWTATSGATNYNIYRSTTSNSYGAAIASGVPQPYVDTNVVEGTTYYYKITSFNGAESPKSNEVSGNAIAAFSIDSTTALSPTSIRIDWSAPAGAGALYDIIYKTGATTLEVANVSLPNYTLTGLSAGTTYDLSVRAKNAIGNGTSVVSAVTTQVTPIGPPTVTLSAQPEQVTVGWNAVGGATNYKISRGIAPATYTQDYTGVTGTSYLNTGLTNGQIYYYAMQTFNGAYSAYSTEVAVKPIETVTIASTSATANTVTVSWNDNALGADAFDVEYKLSTDTTYTTLSNKTSPFPIPGLTANTLYNIRIVGRNAVGAGTTFTSSVASQLTSTAAPANLLATSTAATSISLNWDAVSGATYKIFRTTTAGTYNYATPLASQAGTGYLDTSLTPNVTYYYVVRATNGSDSVSSSQVSRRPVSAFSLSTLTAASSTSLNLTWTASTGADNYKIQYGATSGVYSGTVDNVTGTSATLTGLTADSLYYINIVAQNSSGTALASNERNARTLTVAPSGLTATATTPAAGLITLNWTATAGATNYNIYRSTTSNSYGAALATTQPGTSFADTSVTAGTVYYYVITANNGAESAISNQAFAKTIASFSVGSTSASTTTSIVVNWTTPAGGDNFDILYRSTGATTEISNASSGQTITGLTAGTTYFISVRARNTTGGIGTSFTTAEVSQVTPIAPPATLTASNATVNQVTVGWSAVTGATNYRLYRSTTSNSYGAAHAVGLTGTSTNDSPVTAGTTYYYRMTSFNGAESAPSSEVAIQPIAAFTISATVLSSTSIQINWTNPAGGATYDLTYGLTPGSTTNSMTGVSSGVALTGLSTGTTYYVTVTAKNAVGAGSSRAAPEIGAATAFGAPSGLVATAAPGSITLNWNAVTGAATYSVSRKVAPGAYTEIATGLTTPTYTDNGRTNGVTYDYVVRALDSVPTSSADSSPASARPISTFTQNAATTITATTAALSWSSATGAVSYDVYLGTTSGTYGAAINVAGTSHSLSGLLGGTTYYAKVVAKNSVTSPDTTVNSNEISFTTAPAAISNLAVTSPASNSATLTWSAPTSATALTYTIMRGTTAGTWGTTVVSGLLASTYNDNTVADGTQYHYILIANNGTASANSNEATIKPVSAFAITGTTPISSSSIQINWSAATGADNYDVYIGTTTSSYGGSPAATVTSAFTTATLTGLAAGTNYLIQVRARNAIGTGTTRSTAEQTQITPIGAPTITVTATPTVATVNWGAVTGASAGYKISRGISPGSYDTFYTVAAGVTSLVDSGLTNGQAYYYAVQSNNGALSAFSTEVGVRPIASFTVTSTIATATTINVRWNADAAVAGATTYDVSYRTGADAYIVLTNRTSPFLITGLTAGTSYDIRVTANNTVGANATTFTTAVATQLTALGAPVLSATATPTQVNLNWTSISTSTNYRVYRATTSAGQNYGAAPLATITHPTLIHPDTTATPNGTTYYYTVRSFNGSESVSSNEFVIRPISTFTQTAATSVAATSATLNWGAAIGAASYDVYIGTSSGSYGAPINVATLTHGLTGLTAGSTYFARIVAKNSVGGVDHTTVNSNEISFTTSAAAISNLVATSLIPGRATLTWTAPSSSTSLSYTIKRGVTGTWATTVVSGLTATTYNEDLLTNGTQYYYIVIANNGTVSANSNEATIMPIATPTISATTALSSSSIKVDWSAVAGAATYEVWIGNSTGSYGGTAAASVSSAFTTATITGLSAGTTYYIQLRARNAIGAGTTRSSAEVTQITPIAAPTISSIAGTPGQAIITWNQVTGATGYKISRATSPTSYDTFYTTTGQGSVTRTDTGLTAGQTYYYAVQSENGALSAFSTEVAMMPVNTFTISSIDATANTLTVSWNANVAVTGAASYDVLYRKGTDAYTTVANQTSPAVISGLTAGTYYDVQVVAKNAVGSPTTTSSSTASSSQTTSLGAPTISAITSTNGTVTLNWANTGSSYKIFRSGTSGSYVYSTPINSPAAGTTSYVDSPTINNALVYYVIRSFNGSDSIDSNEASVKPIANFTLASVTATSSSAIAVSWNAATGADSYDVYHKLSSGSYGAPTNVVGTSTTITGLTANSAYTVRVVAKNALGTSGATNTSNELSATTAPGGVSDLALNANDTSSQVGLIWTNVTGATSYRIYRGATAGTLALHATVIASGGATTGYTDVTGVTNGTAYFYSVRSFSSAEGPDSNIEQIKPISIFSLTAATSASSTSVNLTWGSATGADTYDVYYGVGANTTTFNIQNIGGAAATSYTVTGLTPSTQYSFRVRARNLQGTKVTTYLSNAMSATTGAPAPVLSAIAATPGSMTFNIANGAGATNYNVYRSGTAGGPYTQIASAQTAATFTDAAATSGSTWYYMGRAFNGIESSNSNEIFAQPIASFTIAAAGLTTSTIQVTWVNPAGGATYDVSYKIGAGAYTTIANQVSPYTITGLTSNTVYTVMVTAKNAVGGTTTRDSSTTTAATPLGAPAGLAIVGGTSTATLTWTANGATTYKIMRGTVSGSLTQIGTTTSASYPDTGLTNGQTYIYAIIANNGSDSAPSAEVSVQPIAAFAISSVTGPSSTSIQIAWGAAAGATAYSLQWGPTAALGNTVATVTSPYTLTGLTAGTTYYARIVATNAVGAGTTVLSATASGSTNIIPVLSTISNLTTEAPNTINAAFTLTDGNDVLNCATAMSGTSSNTTIVPNTNIVFSGTMPNCSVAVTPGTGQFGTATITITASDTKDSSFTTFDVTFTPCTVASIVWETQPANISAGSAWATAPLVSLRKADNSLCTTNTNPVSLFVSLDPSVHADAAVSGVNPVTPVGGYASFSAATITRAATGYLLAAAQGGVVSLDSSAFNVTALAANKVIWAVQPTTANRTSSIIPAPTVRVADVYGNYVAQGGLSITVSLQDNTEGATLSGTLTRSTDASGAAVFSAMSVNVMGSYFLRATPISTYPLIDSDTFSIIQLIPQNTTAVMEMISGTVIHDTNGNANYPGAGISFGTNIIDGTTTYSWKVVATNTSGQASTIRLKLAGNNISSINVPGNTTVPTLFSTSIANASIGTDGIWSLGAFKGTVVFYSSRIVVQQTNATRTQVYIPLTSMANSTLEALSTSTTSTAYTQPNALNFPTYNWDATKIARVDSILLYVTSRTSGGSSCVGLFNKTTNTQIGAEVCNTGAADSIVSVPILPGSMPATGELEVRMRNGSAGTAFLNRAGLLVRLVSIENMLAVQRVAPAIPALTASTNFVEQRASSFINSYGTGVVSEYVVCRAMANTAGSGSFIYRNHGTNTSGIAGASTIAASTINFTTQSSQTTLEAGPVVTVNNNNQFMNYTHTSGSFALSHCLMETEVAY